MPERVVVLLGVWMYVEPKHEHVLREETNGEYGYERHYHFRHLLARLYLFHLQYIILNNNMNNELNFS